MVQRLFLNDCNVVEDDITKLAKVVGKVEWRGPLNRNHDHGRFSHATTAGQGSARTIKAHRTPLAPPRTILTSH